MQTVVRFTPKARLDDEQVAAVQRAVAMIVQPTFPKTGGQPALCEFSRIVAAGTDCARLLWAHGVPTICPVQNEYLLYDAASVQSFVEGRKAMMYRCNVCVALPGWADAQDALAVTDVAEHLGVPIFEWPTPLDGEHMSDYMSRENEAAREIAAWCAGWNQTRLAHLMARGTMGVSGEQGKPGRRRY
jgi:hypothetical protein